MESLNVSSPTNQKNHNLKSPSSAPSRRQWSLPRRLMSIGFTGLNRTHSNIESKVYTRQNASEEYENIKYIE